MISGKFVTSDLQIRNKQNFLKIGRFYLNTCFTLKKCLNLPRKSYF